MFISLLERESYLKAFKFALQVGILHTLGAFILVSLIVLSVGEAITFFRW